MMYCVKCGKELADGARFCPSCGAEQTAVPKTPRAPAAPPSPSSPSSPSAPSLFNRTQNSSGYAHADLNKEMNKLSKEQARMEDMSTLAGWFKHRLKLWGVFAGILLILAIVLGIYATVRYTFAKTGQSAADSKRIAEGKTLDIVTPFEQYVVFEGPEGEAKAKIVLPDDFEFTVESNGVYAVCDKFGMIDIVKDSEKLGRCYVNVSPGEGLSSGDTIELGTGVEGTAEWGDALSNDDRETLQDKLNDADVAIYPQSIQITVPQLSSKDDFSLELLQENLDSVIKGLTEDWGDLLAVYYGTAKPESAQKYKTIVVVISGNKENRYLHWVQGYTDPYIENGVLMSQQQVSNPSPGEYDYENDIYTNDAYDLVRVY